MLTHRSQLYVNLYGTESSSTVLTFSRLLYHLDLGYEIGRLATDPAYREFEFPRYTFRRVVSPLHYYDQLQLTRVRHESPWELSVAVQAVTLVAGGLGGLWALIQIVDKISMYPLNRKKAKIELARAVLELDRLNKTPLGEVAIQPLISDGGKSMPSNLPAKFVRPTRLERVSAQIADSETDSVLVPTSESVKFYNRLRNRRVDDMYESNIRILQKLGFKVKDIDIGLTDDDNR